MTKEKIMNKHLRHGEDTYLGGQRDHIYEAMEEYAKQKCKQHGIKLLKCVPHTWLDSLLTGDEKVIKSPYDEQDIERLLLAIRKRMLSKSLEEK